MKKVLFILFAASLFLTAACEKSDPVYPDPATKKEAVIIKFNKGQVPQMTISKVDVTITEIDLTEASRYVLFVTKGDGKSTVWMGQCAPQNGTYNLQGFGNIELLDGKVAIRPSAGVTVRAESGVYTYEATILPMPQISPAAANLCRNWKVKSTFVKLEGGKADQKVSVSKSFVGCDLHEIARTLKENKIGISDADVAKLAGYHLTELNFIGNSTMIMNFDGPESYYGSWILSGNTITWEINNSNALLSAKATGTISFPGNKSAQLLINTDVAAGDKKYTGTIRFDLEQID
ncbi:MAG: hypothetical protein IKX03_06340 [Bacteroidales bacterium]|nr:hypothetical protein [Bacteroidales bacterium]